MTCWPGASGSTLRASRLANQCNQRLATDPSCEICHSHHLTSLLFLFFVFVPYSKKIVISSLIQTTTMSAELLRIWCSFKMMVYFIVSSCFPCAALKKIIFLSWSWKCPMEFSQTNTVTQMHHHVCLWDLSHVLYIRVSKKSAMFLCLQRCYCHQILIALHACSRVIQIGSLIIKTSLHSPQWSKTWAAPASALADTNEWQFLFIILFVCCCVDESLFKPVLSMCLSDGLVHWLWSLV